MKKETFKRLLETADIEYGSRGTVIISNQEEPNFYFEFCTEEDRIVDDKFHLEEPTPYQETAIRNVAWEFAENETFTPEKEGLDPINHYDEYGLSESDFLWI